jgi:Protein kinase domain
MLLGGRYRLLSPLGRGGMGEVWEGRDERLGRPVAVKLLATDALPPARGPDDRVRRFNRETAVTAGLVHPGVPAIHDAGEYENGLYLVMELVDGCTLGDLIAEQGPLPVPWVAAIGAQIAAVLAFAHAREVIHRDIKPQNVMLMRDGSAKVLDFGVAGIVSQRITSTGVTVGTPAYMAPEQAYNIPATPRTDLYALGCLLYEMLSGRPVFAATSPAALMRMHLEQAPEPLWRPDLDPRLKALVWQLLEKDPARRPSGAVEAYSRLLPLAYPQEPLGDISPAPGRDGGARLYSQLYAQISAASSAPAIPPAFPATPAPVAVPAPPAAPLIGQAADREVRGAGWTMRHSLWILPTLVFGWFAWVSFGYIGAKHQRRSWLIAAVAYFVVPAAGFVFILTGQSSGHGIFGPAWLDAGLVLWVLPWPVGFIHAVIVNFNTRLPLLKRP